MAEDVEVTIELRISYEYGSYCSLLWIFPAKGKLLCGFNGIYSGLSY